MIYYLDASAAVAAVTQEAHSPRIWQWLTDHADAPILCSSWVATEVSSTLSIKVRAGAFTMEQRMAAWNSWRRLRQNSLGEIDIAPKHFETAAAFCARADLGLRAGEGLHLAIAESAGLRLVTFDQAMADAALQLGIDVEPL